ncbi:MAG: PadR family transcriptional regulator [Gemmatimonadaceae bacterium]
MKEPETLPVAKGMLDVLVLRALSWTPMHGFEVVEWIESRSTRALDLEDSAVYQALYRMEQRELVDAKWGVTSNNRRARYYHVTPKGTSYLKAETSRWLRYAELVTELLSTPLVPKGRVSS